MRARSCAGAHVDEVQAHAAQAAGGAQLQLARAGGPHRVAARSRRAARLRAVAVRAGGRPTRRAARRARACAARRRACGEPCQPTPIRSACRQPERDAHGEARPTSPSSSSLTSRGGAGVSAASAPCGPHEPAGGGAGGGREQRASRDGGRGPSPPAQHSGRRSRSGVAARPSLSSHRVCWRAGALPRRTRLGSSGTSSSASSSTNPGSVAAGADLLERGEVGVELLPVAAAEPSPPARPSSAAISSWSSRPTSSIARGQRLGGLDLDPPVALQAGGRRDQLADDHVLLEPVEAVDLALQRGVGEHLGGLLEGGRRQERVGVQRRLGDAEDDVLELGRLFAALLDDRVVDLGELEAVHELARAGSRCRPSGRRAPS